MEKYLKVLSTMKFSSQDLTGNVTTSSPSGVTSVWVGKAKDTHHRPPPPPHAKLTNHHNSVPETELGSSHSSNHLKNRRLTTTAGNGGDEGKYVVVAVRNSISESGSPFGRRNSTVIPNMSSRAFGMSRSFSCSDRSRVLDLARSFSCSVQTRDSDLGQSLSSFDQTRDSGLGRSLSSSDQIRDSGLGRSFSSSDQIRDSSLGCSLSSSDQIRDSGLGRSLSSSDQIRDSGLGCSLSSSYQIRDSGLGRSLSSSDQTRDSGPGRSLSSSDDVCGMNLHFPTSDGSHKPCLTRSLSISDQTHGNLMRNNLTPLSLPSSSVGSIPLQTRFPISGTSVTGATNCHGSIGNGPSGNSNNFPADEISNVLSESNLGISSTSGGSNPSGTNHSITGNMSLYTESKPDSFLSNNVNDLLSVCGSNVLGNNGPLCSAGSLFPSVLSTTSMLPLASSGISPLFPQPSRLLTDLAASSFQTLNLCQATTGLGSLKQPQTLLPTTTLAGFSTTPFLPIGQLSQPFPQMNTLLGLSQVPVLPIPSLSPFNVLPTFLPLSQPWMSQPDLTFSTLLPPIPALPLSTTTATTTTTSAETLPSQKTSATAARDAKPQVKRRSPPPLLHQNPSEAYLARRSSLKAGKELAGSREEAGRGEAGKQMGGREGKSLTHLSLIGDQQEVQHITSSGEGSPVPTTPSPTYSPCPLDGAAEMQFPTDVYPVGVGLSVEPCYYPPDDPQCCMRCDKKVYRMEKQVGPVRHVLYHQACFTCSACGTVLSLGSYYTNDADKDDLNVYCASHKPLVRSTFLDSEALLLQQATLALPKLQLCV